eukprot:g1365.t1
MKRVIRHSERTRKASSCAFADRVTKTAIQHYRNIVPKETQEKMPQTVLAAMLVGVPKINSSVSGPGAEKAEIDLFVVSMGIGTKFLNCKAVKAHRNGQHKVVTDCHAEALMQAGFQRFLQGQLRQLMGKNDTTGDCANTTTTTTTTTTHRCGTVNKNKVVNTTPDLNVNTDDITSRTKKNGCPLILEKVWRSDNADIGNGAKGPSRVGCGKVKAGITFHVYCSSQPCGNGIVKKWYKGAPITQWKELTMHEWPSLLHPPEYFPCQNLGQIQLLWKDNHTTLTMGVAQDKGNSIIDFAQPCLPTSLSQSSTTKSRNNNDNNIIVPPGTCTLQKMNWCKECSKDCGTKKGSGNLLTCSAKILLWNFVGWQGHINLHHKGRMAIEPPCLHLESPIKVKTITVGRKYNEKLCRRAMCCRLQRFMKPKRQKRHRKKRDKRTSSSTASSDVTSTVSSAVMAQNNPSTLAYTCSDDLLDERFVLSHPNYLTSTIKFDETTRGGDIAMGSNSGASASALFSSECLAWWLEETTEILERIDGNNGYLRTDTLTDSSRESDVSKLAELSLDDEYHYATLVERIRKYLS